MSKIPTAEEMEMSDKYDSYQDMMIAFAKMHVKAALEAINDKTFDELTEWDGNPYTGEGSTYINKNAIINAYPLTNIK